MKYILSPFEGDNIGYISNQNKKKKIWCWKVIVIILNACNN